MVTGLEFDISRFPLLMREGIAPLNGHQKKLIRERDQNRCQFPFEHECDNDLDIHHIKARAEARRRNRAEEAETPENTILLCHHSHHDLIHNPKAAGKHALTPVDHYYDDKLKEVARRNTEAIKDKPWWKFW